MPQSKCRRIYLHWKSLVRSRAIERYDEYLGPYNETPKRGGIIIELARHWKMSCSDIRESISKGRTGSN